MTPWSIDYHNVCCRGKISNSSFTISCARSRAKPGDQREVLEEAFAPLLALGAEAGSRPADVLEVHDAGHIFVRSRCS
jgi:hypothetical protein